MLGALAAAAAGLLLWSLHEPFDLTLINLGATNFSAAAPSGGNGLAPALQRLLGKRKEPCDQEPFAAHQGKELMLYRLCGVATESIIN